MITGPASGPPLPMSYVIAVLNQKGGVGKSTLSTNLARGLQLQGYAVMVIDADPQGTARDWRVTAGDEVDLPAVFGVDRPTLDKDIPKVSHAFDVVVIDGAAKAADMMASAVKAADLILIPIQPSAADLWAVTDLVDLVHARRVATDGRPEAAFVISRQIQGTRLAAGVGEALATHGFPVLEARTTQRVAYSEALGLGLSVFEYEPDGKAAEEMTTLTEEISRYINGNV